MDSNSPHIRLQYGEKDFYTYFLEDKEAIKEFVKMLRLRGGYELTEYFERPVYLPQMQTTNSNGLTIARGMPSIIKCLNCNESFYPKTSAAQYCSTRCRVAHHRKKDKTDQPPATPEVPAELAPKQMDLMEVIPEETIDDLEAFDDDNKLTENKGEPFRFNENGVCINALVVFFLDNKRNKISIEVAEYNGLWDYGVHYKVYSSKDGAGGGGGLPNDLAKYKTKADAIKPAIKHIDSVFDDYKKHGIPLSIKEYEKWRDDFLRSVEAQVPIISIDEGLPMTKTEAIPIIKEALQKDREIDMQRENGKPVYYKNSKGEMIPDYTDYEPSHPWYYKRGGPFLSYEEIEPVEHKEWPTMIYHGDSKKKDGNYDFWLKRKRLVDHELEYDLQNYNTAIEDFKATEEPEIEQCTAISLTHNHISYSKGSLNFVNNRLKELEPAVPAKSPHLNYKIADELSASMENWAKTIIYADTSPKTPVDKAHWLNGWMHNPREYKVHANEEINIEKYLLNRGVEYKGECVTIIDVAYNSHAEMTGTITILTQYTDHENVKINVKIHQIYIP